MGQVKERMICGTIVSGGSTWTPYIMRWCTRTGRIVWREYMCRGPSFQLFCIHSFLALLCAFASTYLFCHTQYGPVLVNVQAIRQSREAIKGGICYVFGIL